MTKTSLKKIALRAFFGLAVVAVASLVLAGSAQAASPRVETMDADVLTSTSARMNGELNPRDEETTYWFEYGTSRSNLNRDTSRRDVDDFDATISVSNTISGLARDMVYYFRLVAENSDGTVRGSILSLDTSDVDGGSSSSINVETRSAQPNSISATLNGDIESRATMAEIWFRYGTSRSNLDRSTNSTSLTMFSMANRSFSQGVSNLLPGTTYYYQAAARNSFGTDYGQVLSFTTSGSNGGNNNGGNGTGQTPTVSTNSAAVLGRTSATLRAQVNPNGTLTAIWFEYGRSPSLGGVTTRDPAGSGTSFTTYSATVNGLSAGSLYYYRAVAQSPSGINYGQTVTFRTEAAPAGNSGSGNSNGGNASNTGGTTDSTPPVSVVTTTPIDASGCFTVNPVLSSSQLKANEDFTYSVTYRNSCTATLTNGSLQITLPPATDFAGTNFPFLSRDGNVITYSLGTIAPNFQAAVTINGKVRSQVGVGDSLIFQANVTFTDPNGTLQNASGFISATITEGGADTSSSTLGASAADALGGLFHSGWFWLVLFLILIALFVFWLATRRRGNDEDEEEGEAEAHGH